MKLRAGVYGGGDGGIRSAMQLDRSADCVLAAVADADAVGRTALANFASGPVVAESLPALLATGIDFLVHCEPVAERVEHVRLAAEQAVPCLLQTPMAASFAEAAAMLACCDEAQVPLGVLVPAMADPLFEQLRQMIVDDWFGGLVHIHSLRGGDDMLRHPPRTGAPRLLPPLQADPLLRYGSEHVHLANWLCGKPPLRVSAQRSSANLTFPTECVTANVLLQGNVTAAFTATHLLDIDEFAVHGLQGRVTVTTDHVILRGRRDYRGEVFAYEQPDREQVLSRAELAAAPGELAAALELHGRFARSLDDRDSFPCLGEQAAFDLRLLDAIGRALQSDRTEDIR